MFYHSFHFRISKIIIVVVVVTEETLSITFKEFCPIDDYFRIKIQVRSICVGMIQRCGELVSRCR